MKIPNVVKNFDEILCAVFMAVMACLAFANVISRYLLHYSISFSQEIVLNSFVWATFLGTAIGFKRGNHVKVTFIIDKMPTKIKRIVKFLGVILSGGLFLLLMICSIDQIVYEIDLRTTSDSLNIPVYWYTLGVPIFSLLIMFRIVQAFIKSLSKGE
jgi:TRAP-type C4-dicarboxylate transport system permease small subunit